jgi:hypothetical protein
VELPEGPLLRCASGDFRPNQTCITSEWLQQSGHFSDGIKSRPSLQTIRQTS